MKAADSAYAKLKQFQDKHVEEALTQAKEHALEKGRETVVMGTEKRRLDQVPGDRLTMLSLLHPAVGEYDRALATVERLQKTVSALKAGQPLPLGPSESEVEYCVEDMQGAWAFWTVSASYGPGNGDPEQFLLAREVRLARVTSELVVSVAAELPSLMDPVDIDPRFLDTPNANCCESGYGVGAPRIVFNHDQTGDGIPEVAVTATFAVEGSSERRGYVYRYASEGIVSQRLDFDNVRDVDADGRIDLEFVEDLEVGEDCDTGFSTHLLGARYVAHALPDGSYSFTDEAARAFSRTQCPNMPSRIASGEDIWCAKLWGMPSKQLEQKLRNQCAKQSCPPSAVPPCAELEVGVRAFEPKLSLKAP